MNNLLTKKVTERKQKNPNPVCFKKIVGYATILIKVDESNIAVFEKLQPLSCTRIDVGDYIVHDQWNSQQLFDKNLKPKSFKSTRFEYFLNEDKTTLLEREKSGKQQKYKYREIITDDDLRTALMFNNYSKKGMIIVSDDVISKEQFLQDYEIINP